MTSETIHLDINFTIDKSFSGLKAIKANALDFVPLVVGSTTSSCPNCNCNINLIINLYDEQLIRDLEQNFCEVDQIENLEVKVEPKLELEDDDLTGPEFKDDPEPTESLIKSSNDARKRRPQTKRNPKPTKKSSTSSNSKAAKRKLCHLCYTEFDSDRKYKSHVKNHTLTCKLCEPHSDFKSIDSLRKHTKRKHYSVHPNFSKGQDCPKCEKRYVDSCLATHIKKCPGKPICNICNRQLKDWYSVHCHIRTRHEGIYPFICHICGAQYATKHGLDTHSFLHGDQRKLVCDLCQKEFRSRYLIAEHMKKIHLQLQHTTYTCETCGKTFNSKQYFRIHKVNHLEVKPHVCQICSKGFAKRYTLLKHEKIHSDTRSEVCNVCDKMFRDRTSLGDHMRLHSGEKPYECEICLRKFHDRGCYRGHLLKHEKELGVVLDKSIKRFRKEESVSQDKSNSKMGLQ